jgi:hypothetical protein
MLLMVRKVVYAANVAYIHIQPTIIHIQLYFILLAYTTFPYTAVCALVRSERQS